MNDTLPWTIKGKTFRDSSRLEEWVKIYQSPDWHWQYDTHELTFAIYEHDGQYWKLYHARFVESGAVDYSYDYGGQAWPHGVGGISYSDPLIAFIPVEEKR